MEELKWASKSASATLTLLHSELALCTLKLCFSVFQFWYKLLYIFKIGTGQPMVTIWVNLVGPESQMLHTKFQGLRPFKSRTENFHRVFTIYGHGEYLDPFVQIWRVSTQWRMSSFKVISHSIPETIFKGFYHIWAWWPSWSCEPEFINKLLFRYPTKVLHVIWFLSPQQFWEENKNTESEASMTKVSKGPWPLVFIKNHLAHCKYQLWCHRLQQARIKTQVTKFDLAVKRSRSTKDLDLWYL